MKTRIHALAGGIGFLTILVFWTSTVISELLTSHETVATVKQSILYGMIVLIPAMAVAGGSGMSMGKARTDAPAMAKKKRMPLIAANGLLVLVPAAFYLASKSAAGAFDTSFYAVQVFELIAGAANLTMMGLNIRDGLTMTGRIDRTKKHQRNAPADAVIEERENGPFVAKGVSRFTGTAGDAVEASPAMALCRCGASKNKPYCDGSHAEIGFDSRPSDERLPDKLRAYAGNDITVYYNRLLCTHAAKCVKLRAVFDPARRPWIAPDNGEADDIVAAVTACPSGALSYSLPDQERRHAVAEEPGITIEKNGPYRVCGITLADARIAEGGCPDKYLLCRCGASKNKPYCDGSHNNIDWNG